MKNDDFPQGSSRETVCSKGCLIFISNVISIPKTVPKEAWWEKHKYRQIQSDRQIRSKGLCSKLIPVLLVEHLQKLLSGPLCIQIHHIHHKHMDSWCAESKLDAGYPLEEQFCCPWSVCVSCPILCIGWARHTTSPINWFVPLHCQLPARAASRGVSAWPCSSWVPATREKTCNLDQRRGKLASFSISSSEHKWLVSCTPELPVITWYGKPITLCLEIESSSWDWAAAAHSSDVHARVSC